MKKSSVFLQIILVAVIIIITFYYQQVVENYKRNTIASYELGYTEATFDNNIRLDKKEIEFKVKEFCRHLGYDYPSYLKEKQEVK